MAQCSAVDEPAPRVVLDQQLSHRLLRPVRGLRHQLVQLRHDVGQLAAVDRAAAREDDPRAMTARAADLQQRSRRVEVDAHAEIEIRLSLAADNGSKVKDRGGIGVDQALEQRRIGNVAGERADPRVAGRWGRDDVEEHEAVDCLFPAVEAGELAALEQLLRQTLSEKSCAAGDENFH